MGDGLAATLLRQLTPDVQARLGDRGGVDGVLQRWLTEARTAWPGVDLAPQVFVEFVAGHLSAAASHDLAQLQGTDLYLACACALGDAKAYAALETRFFPALNAPLRRMRLPLTIDEIKQEVRIRLFVGPGDASPRIARYSGVGPLSAWLRVFATRVAIRLVRRQRPSPINDDVDELARLSAEDAGPELYHVTSELQPILARAFAGALAALTVRQRTLLSHHYLDELSIDRIGVIFGVHRATVARWLIQTRSALLDLVRRQLTRSLGSPGEVDSVLRYLQGNFEMTLSRLLRPTP